MRRRESEHRPVARRRTVAARARRAVERGRLDRDRARALELGARGGVAVAQREARHPPDPRIEVVAQPPVRRLDVLLGSPGREPSVSNARSKSIRGPTPPARSGPGR